MFSVTLDIDCTNGVSLGGLFATEARHNDRLPAVQPGPNSLYD